MAGQENYKLSGTLGYSNFSANVIKPLIYSLSSEHRRQGEKQETHINFLKGIKLYYLIQSNLDIFFSGSISSSFLSVLPDHCCEPLSFVKHSHVTSLGPDLTMRRHHLHCIPPKPFLRKEALGKLHRVGPFFRA